MNATKSEILSCPFCGGVDIRFTDHGKIGSGIHCGDNVWSTCCYQCGATFPNRYRKELLVEQWKKRPDESEPEASRRECAQLKGYLDEARRLIASALPAVQVMLKEAYGTSDPEKIADDEEWWPALKAFPSQVCGVATKDFVRREVLEKCVEALAHCYDVTEWPADGTSAQADALKAATAELA